MDTDRTLDLTPRSAAAELPPVAVPRAQASGRLAAIVNGLESDRIPLGEIVDRMGQAGFGLALLLITLIVLIPIPGPLGMVFGTVIVFLSLQLLTGARRLWLPGFMRRAQIPMPTLRRFLDRVLPWLAWLELRLKPRRWTPLSGRTARIVLVLPLAALGAAITLPIPLGNFMPALALMVFALGLIARDGLAIVIGSLLTVLALAWTAALVFAGAEILDFAFGWLRS
ncbi:exopolysaccharide biosynthesis protein [Prosthecomicrobium sp. N25]|uniref:exopolysaccharide biosynthesis protein n=1 Tax=Prosthecomicrobium sp. N25 TaxID=3129254 RepID=UPI003078A4B6